MLQSLSDTIELRDTGVNQDKLEESKTIKSSEVIKEENNNNK